MGDVSGNIHATDTFVIGFEGLYRIDKADSTSTAGSAGAAKVFAGLVDFNYSFTDVWDGTLKVAYAHQNNTSGAAGSLGTVQNYNGIGGLVNATGLRTNVVQGSLATQYQIADGAKLQAEFRLDWMQVPSSQQGTASKKWGMSYGPILNFAYAF